MRNKVFFFLLAGFLTVFSTNNAAGQSDSYVNGYTSIDYDSSTNTVTAYGYTQATYVNAAYYKYGISQSILDPNDIQLAHLQSEGTTGNPGVANLTAAGVGCGEYRASAHHYMLAYYYVSNYYSNGSYQSGWYDPYNYQYYSGTEETYPNYFTIYGNGPNYVLQSQFTYLGYTDSYSTGNCPASECGDQRDTIRREYRTYGVNLRPTCPDFTQVRGTIPFPFESLNTGDYSWALIRYPLIESDIASYGLWKWSNEYGGSMTVNSAYRNPSRNRRIGGASASRHMYGDAADIKNDTRSRDEYDQRAAAAQRSEADYIEPWTGPCGNGCVHADWRNHAGGY